MTRHQANRRKMSAQQNITVGTASGRVDTTIQSIGQNPALWNEMYIEESAFHLHSKKQATPLAEHDQSPVGEHLREDEKRAWQDPTLIGGYVAHREQWL